MFERLFIGNKVVKLKVVDSTNVYLKRIISNSENEVEGLVVTTQNQLKGRGQKGNTWESEQGKNLTFSLYLKPNLFIQHQFLISKVISLGIVDFLDNLGIKSIKIKWPNDIYCGDKKIAGILIENSLKGNKIYSSVVGVGLNVNQEEFSTLNYPTSILKELGGNELDLDEMLHQLLFFIEKRYIVLKSGKETVINENYTSLLFGINEFRSYKINNSIIIGKILGVSSIGKLRININDMIEEFDLKELEFVFG